MSMWVLISYIKGQLTLTMHTAGATRRTTSRTSADFVTSTLTHRLVFFLSMVSRSLLAVGLV